MTISDASQTASQLQNADSTQLLREIERPLLDLSLQATRGNLVRAAQLLGLNRNTLRKKLRDLQLVAHRGLI